MMGDAYMGRDRLPLVGLPCVGYSVDYIGVVPKMPKETLDEDKADGVFYYHFFGLVFTPTGLHTGAVPRLMKTWS